VQYNLRILLQMPPSPTQGMPAVPAHKIEPLMAQGIVAR
jgi:hypothetical protein